MGNEIGTVGDTYSYPDSFNIIGIRDGVVVKIRGRIIEDILALQDYTYDNLPLINARGFGIRVSTKEEFEQLMEERNRKLNITTDVEFSNQWFSLDQYKHIKFNEDVYTIEYNI
ncbi:hypothetical protein Ana3638_18030 [Anaerocolumna sedimenticola]|uniref:Uncharacterized protein n=1 Tax=Anaerocolumna sedimenticola TaxID=2696063 RepID=A0A6P1TSM0_9FIRM|nr:hypothetical protein [Anaerocolumna sedimenticola]QHQ62448.1 hypothetical protein Ana3638_18030 [Anaerocolumna sedimenticola]